MPKSSETTYRCKICDTTPDQHSHHKAHLKTEKHDLKLALFKSENMNLEIRDIINNHPTYKNKYNKYIELDNNSDEYKKAKTELINNISDKLSNNKTVKNKEAMPLSPEPELQLTTITNREALKVKIHDIHNFLRNNGAGYGMNALKVFNILYGLKKIEENGLFDKVNLDECCRFSKLLELSKNGEDEKLAELIFDDVLESISNSNIGWFLFYEIPNNMKGNVFSYLLKELEDLTKIEKACNIQLSGKIYEYFIGRDKTAISELGAYFTDRHIVNYIYKLLNLSVNEDNTINSMIDMFGGSGGFTTGYINWLIKRNGSIDWKEGIKQIHHYDMNEDVIKSAALEFFCLTGELPNKDNLQYKNSFTDEFDNKKFKTIITNPPYGGDKSKKTDAQKKRNKIKDHIKDKLKTETVEIKIKNMKKQLKEIEYQDKIDKKQKEKNKVTLIRSSKRVQQFAKKHGLKGHNKESVSLILMMDLLEEDGIAVGVLKDGVIFDGKYKDITKCLIENFNVSKVISVPKDQFENTSTKTSIVVFENTEQKTEHIQFYELNVIKYEYDKFEEVDGYITLSENKGDIKAVSDNLIGSANIKELSNNEWSLNGKDYNKKEIIPGDGYELVKLGDITLLKGSNHYTKIGGKKGKYRFYNSSQTSKLYVDFCEINELSIILGQGGNFNIHLDNKFTPSKHVCVIQLKLTNNDLLKYIYYIIPKLQQFIITNGSTINWLNNKNIKNINIPIPKDKQKMIEWSEKISKPYNEKQEKQNKINELDKEIQDKVKYITENEECEEKTIDELYNVLYGDKNKTINTTTPIYYKIGGGANINNLKKGNNWNTKSHTIIVARSGSPGNVNIFNTNTLVGSFAFTLNYKIDTFNIYNYNYLKIHQPSLINMSEGSVQKNLNRENLKKFKIKIPNDKKHIHELEPAFIELEQLKNDVKEAEIKFNSLIEELANVAIKQ